MSLDQDIDKFLEKIKGAGDPEPKPEDDFIIVCLYQLTSNPNPKREGWGDCSVCKRDNKNFDCRGYHPVKVWAYQTNAE